MQHADVSDCLRNLRKHEIKSDERKIPRQVFTKIKYEEEDDHLMHLLDDSEDVKMEHDLHGAMNSDAYRRAPDRLNVVERLRESISLGDVRLLRRLVKEHVDPRYYGSEWYLRCVEPDNLDSLLHYAAEIGRTRVVRYLITKLKHSTVGIENLSGDCPIHVVCRTGNVEILNELLNAPDASLHIRQRQEYTPLHLASLYGHVDVVRVLLDHGANTTHHTRGGYTPLDLAIHNNHTLVAQVLKDHIARTSSNVAAESGNSVEDGVVVGRMNGKLLYSSGS
jgi:ankyrin repeat protein